MIGFIVEGHMEAEIIRQMCKGAELRRLQMNGCMFPVHRIGERIDPHIKMLRRKGVSRIIVIIDREQREMSSEEFESQIVTDLERRGTDTSMLIVASPDRNFESWILPFVNNNCDIGIEPSLDAEGLNGKAIIKEKFKAGGSAYVETVDGVRLFKRVKCSSLKNVSVSFNRLSARMDIDCWWLEN